MRREGLYLRDIVQAADAIRAFLTGVDRENFLASDMIRSAVLHKLTIIGEAAARIPDEARQLYDGVPWRDIIGFRNIVVHACFPIDWSVVWLAAAERVPELRSYVAAILSRDYPEIRGETAGSSPE